MYITEEKNCAVKDCKKEEETDVKVDECKEPNYDSCHCLKSCVWTTAPQATDKNQKFK